MQLRIKARNLREGDVIRPADNSHLGYNREYTYTVKRITIERGSFHIYAIDCMGNDLGIWRHPNTSIDIERG